LGFCTPLALLLWRLIPFLAPARRWLSLIVGLSLIALGIYLNGQVSYDPWLIWLGVKQVNRLMVDYYPVLPWYGVALLGIFAGHTLYPGGQAQFHLPAIFDNPLVRGLAFLGQHSLLIYLIHQPILLGMLFLVGVGTF
jgi:uncharacterized membrane protein